MKLKTLLALTLVAIACLLGGCASTTTTPQQSHSAAAITYLTFADVWTVTHAAYSGYCDQAVLGKVSPADQADIDKAWNAFRGAYGIALQAAQLDKSQVTPENVRKLSNDLLTLIAATL
jgi:hypothetical protein